MKPVFAIFVALFSSVAFADDLRIVDVRRNIPLSDDEPAYKDYYLSAGDTSSLKKNLVVTAVRKVTIRDASGAQSYGDLQVPVGQLRVLAVYGKVAVAREYKLLSRDEHAMLEQTGIMIGDTIDLKDAFSDAKPMKTVKPKVTEAAPKPAEERATASVAAPAAVTPAAPATPAPAAVVAPAKPASPEAAVPQELLKPTSAVPGEKTAQATATPVN